MPGLWETLSWSTQASFEMFPEMVHHLAPEVHQDLEPSPLVDQYSVGVLLFQLLTNKKPFSGDTTESIIEKHLSAPIPTIKKYNQALPNVLDDIIKKLLAKNPEDRYPNIQAAIKDLKKLKDALRFGKPLNFMNKDFAQSEPKLVAPRMEALQLENKKIRKKTNKRSDSIDKLSPLS